MISGLIIVGTGFDCFVFICLLKDVIVYLFVNVLLLTVSLYKDLNSEGFFLFSTILFGANNSFLVFIAVLELF